MRHRLLPLKNPTIGALAAGFLVLLWGLFSLQRVFQREQEDARQAVLARQTALAEYARRTLGQRLEERWRGARQEAERALEDPLAAADHLLLFDRGEQRLPRQFTPVAGQETSGRELFLALRSGAGPTVAAEPDSPWEERLVLYQRFATAVDGDQPAAITGTFRAILAHRLRYRIPRTLDLPYMIALLELFAAESRPDPALLQALLYDGLDDGRGGKVRDLSRLLLEQRHRFTAADFKFLSDRLAALAERHQVPYEAFVQRAREERGEALTLPDGISAPALVLDGRWYAAPLADGRVLGMAVDVPQVLREITSEMTERGLIAAGDRVVRFSAAPAGGHVGLEALRLQLDSPSWAAAFAAARERYRLKTALTTLCALFALAIVVLALVFQRRRHRLLELKSDFVAAVSHELRTPLASVRLLAETLERRLGGHAPARDYPSRIVCEVDGLSFLVENILSFHRLDKGRWQIRPADVPGEELAGYLDCELGLLARKPVDLRCDGLRELTLRGDPELLKLLFLNLARNACQYHDRDRVVVTIERSAAARSGGGCVLHVRDNGRGLREDEKERVFTEFYRGNTAGTGGGTGLGLAICRRIMKLHGGHIRVAATSSGGTTFELTFPQPGGRQG